MHILTAHLDEFIIIPTIILHFNEYEDGTAFCISLCWINMELALEIDI